MIAGMALIQSLPMGWSNSVFVVHSIQGELLPQAGIDLGLKIIGSKCKETQAVRYCRSIEYFLIIGHNRKKVEKIYRTAWITFVKINLNPQPSKFEATSIGTKSILGT